MSSKYRKRDGSSSDSDSEEERKRKDIKERDEFSNHLEGKDECETKKFVLLAGSTAAGEAAESLQVDPDEPKDKLVPKLYRIRSPGEDEKKERTETKTAGCKLTTIEETQRNLPISPFERDLTQDTKVHEINCIRTKAENEQLIGWIRNYENEKVKASLKDSRLRHSVDELGRTLLHISAECGNVTATNYMLDNFDVDARDSNGRTALMLAVEQNHANVVETLLAGESDIGVVDNEGKNVLHVGFAKKDLTQKMVNLLLRELHKRCASSEAIAEKLVDSGCRIYQAVCARDVALVKSMLARGIDVNAAHPDTKRTGLHMSVSLVEPEIVKVLLEGGADAEALDDQGISPLFYNYVSPQTSGKQKQLEILDLLLARKVSLTATTERGEFQVSPTLMHGCAEAIARILRSGYLDFSVADAIYGSRAIQYLAMNRNRGVVQQLKLHAAGHDYYVNATDNRGTVPLHRALVKGNVEMLQFLLEQGADANYAIVKNDVGTFTPLFLCAEEGVPFTRDCLAETLLQHKANPQASFTGGNGKVFTVFDLGPKSTPKPVIAHLAMIERQGELIAELIREKINSSVKFQRYFNRYQAVLDIELFESITVLNLLTDSEKRVMGYLSNGELRLKLKKLNHKLRIQHSFSYYFNTLRKRLVKLLRLKGLRDEVAGIVCKWFENPLDERHIVIERMLDFLDVTSLERLTSL